MTMGRLLITSLVLVAALVAASSGNDSEENPEVRAPIGRIKGSLMTTRLGRNVYAFRGVRYAEPPTGQQRFQPPIAAKPYGNEVYDASEEGPSCPYPGGKLINEDCLRLNVYTTKLAPSTTTKTAGVKRPVIVYFHPGGFYSLSGQSFLAGPEYLLDQDVVLVTVNYRLASLGFLSTGDSLAPGNLGFKDQVEALKWIQKNIAAFGGNPNQVTISGCSAGGYSVSLHMVSPMSKNLFHRAIAVSGAATLHEPLPLDQKHLAKKQAELLGCPTDTTGNMLICLNTKPIEDYMDSLAKFAEWHGDPILIWSPVVEPEVHGVERFLEAQPVDLIREGKFYQVPVMAGQTKDEFGGVTIIVVEMAKNGNDSVIQEYNDSYEKIFPISFFYERDTNRSTEISQALKEFYIGDKPFSLENIDGVAKLYCDVVGYPVRRFVDLVSNNSREPVYYYNFAYQGRHSLAKWSDGKPYGVAHQDDLQYIFNITEWFPSLQKDDPEVLTTERVTAMWASFALSGDPIPKNNDKFKDVSWEPYTKENQRYLEINDNLVMKTGLYLDRMNLWDKLFALWPIGSNPVHESH